MPSALRVSLNAIRVFATVARRGSLTAAADELCVTSSAVSHQLKKLEDELGITLLRRGSNTVSLNEAGRRFYDEVGPAIALIERSTDALRRDESEISVQASTSLAVRWLIPSLDRFRALCPKARVRVETGPARGALDTSFCDVEVRYFREGVATDGWSLLAPDTSRPVVSPHVLSPGSRRKKLSIFDLPAIQRATGNWDWACWGSNFGISLTDLHFAHTFDTDDAALQACVAGLGVVLAPPILTRKECRAGILVALPGFEAIKIGEYRYQRRSDSRVARRFCEWMEAEVRDTD
ncbi:LysR family transcriptional regulator [Cupriavidus pauculus]|uniref:Transcriptional regulator n=1 Tax=Cupriavidus pauculus TaxID=82633 RepID=A0A2N5CBA1_9BURK|nr:LysR family transcriptional regulator [Cupriavidus pauculus]PLP99498.1 transcriptional regulator [Cupriavidus pauculus]